MSFQLHKAYTKGISSSVPGWPNPSIKFSQFKIEKLINIDHVLMAVL